MKSPLRPERMPAFSPAARIDSLEIRWPDGTLETRRDVPEGSALLLEEGKPPAKTH
jgi:hypothetical protein